MTSERFAALAEKYMDTIYRLAYSCTRSTADADDVTQEVLIHLYREEKDFQSDEHVKNWLMKVTINQCRMLFRSPWRKAEPIDDYAETLQMENEDQVELFTLVMGLEKKYRVVIHLFYYEGYSVKEISELLNIPEKTVRTRLFRARAKLKTILTEEVSDND